MAWASSLSSFHDHSYTPHTVRFLWTSDQPSAETSTRQHATFTRPKHSCPGRIRTRNPNTRAAADPRLRPRMHWDRLHTVIHNLTANYILYKLQNVFSNLETCSFYTCTFIHFSITHNKLIVNTFLATSFGSKIEPSSGH